MLFPPDNFHLSAAVGWVELGNPVEALAELEKIAARYRDEFVVLEVEWVIRAEQKDWDAGLDIARRMVRAASEKASGWLHQAYALRRVKEGGLKAAWESLLPAYEKFPNEPIIAYNLACYACQMGNTDECRDWLQRALKLLGKAEFKKLALNDPDLKALWDEIRDL